MKYAQEKTAKDQRHQEKKLIKRGKNIKPLTILQ